MRKELRPGHEDISCDICERTILKGERTENYLAPGGRRYVVCELCTDRAYHEGWIRESAHDELPAMLPREPRRGLLGRLRGRRRDAEPVHPVATSPPASADGDAATNGAEPAAEPIEPPAPVDSRRRRRESRHVRAVPTNAQVKVERALELFNSSEHVRTIGGIARTLGEPWVSAAPVADAPSEVSVVVAWELSWYRYRVDLGDADDPVSLVDKGQELDELSDSMRDWNATALADGRLAIGVRS